MNLIELVFFCFVLVWRMPEPYLEKHADHYSTKKY
jgi:hypothetical protein